ncbi:MAG: molecular chaperone DnaK [Deltaproteobacteria bacterium]|nr:MAG: molecular chaperone DnaK [Deltaproteobacteria bacterium]
MDFRYIIGIDLGTTNSAVSYINVIEGKDARIKRFLIPQLTRKGEFAKNEVLPSFLYIPGEYELLKEDIKHPWDKRSDDFAGVFARDYGGKVPARLVASAKSWLCHDKVDRNSKILPWGADKGVSQKSPVDVTAKYLSHIKNAWNLDKKQDDSRFFENQFITITIPASFDEAARELTLEASKKAGFKNVILLEEPLAAFYSWLMKREKDWNKYIDTKELVLVCDVGGGTTDFTLIALREVDNIPRFDRIAVGRHLILGGDNIDLAIARLAESKVKSGKSILSGDKWKTLCHLARNAKEKILEGEKDKERITIAGKGSRLIQNTFSVDLEKSEVENIVLNGFFPKIESNDFSKEKSIKKGISEFGLQYESEPAITFHLIDFLVKNKDNVKKYTNKEQPVPDYILFNGGSLKPEIIKKSIKESIVSFFNKNSDEIKILENPLPDTAVSLGAAYYGRVKQGFGVRVGSGSPRSYYLGIDTSKGKKGLICLVERGLEEGSLIKLPDKYSFSVKTNVPVSFDLYSSSFRSNDNCGDFIEEIDDSFTKLPPLNTMVTYGKKNEALDIDIDFKAAYTETGSLSIWCDSKITPHKWDLSFNLRAPDSLKNQVSGSISSDEIIEESLVNEAIELLSNSFTSEGEKVKSVVKEISRLIGKSKNKWPVHFIRKMADFLIEHSDFRTKSSIYEARWLNLVGFCMRPGIGDAMDSIRIKKLWPEYSKGLYFEKDIQNRNEWWIFLRRIAAGLKAGYQRQISQDLSSMLKRKKVLNQEKSELWMAIGNFEYLHSNDKKRFSNFLKQELKPSKFEPKMVLALGRIGAREPLYGDIDKVLDSDSASKLLDFLLTDKWGPSKEARYAVSQTGRLTGDRIRDIDDKKRKEAVNFLEKYEDFENSRFLKEIIEVETSEEKDRFGDSLPSGIILHHKAG